MKAENLLALALLALVGMGIYLLRQQRSSQASQTIQNAETWEWIDALGNKRTMIVHRDVHSR